MSNLNDPFDADKDIWSEESPTAQDTTANPNLVKPTLDQQRAIIGDARGSSIPAEGDTADSAKDDAAALALTNA